MMKTTFAAFLLSVPLCAGAADGDQAGVRPRDSGMPAGIAKGKIIERVSCEKAKGQSYALYVPANYDSGKKWPIVYFFDANAFGVVPVKLFKKAAEELGYILAGSNNSRNGPWEPVAAAVDAIWDDTHERLSLDSARVYTCGFSGGARVACEVAYLRKGAVAGVIACSGGVGSNRRPIRELPFAFFGLAGTKDFNRPELESLDGTLNELGAPHRVVVFDGEHQWPPEDSCREALEWIEIQAIRKAPKGPGSGRAASLFAGGLARAGKAEKAGKPFEAYLRYGRLAEDFGGLCDVSECEASRVRMMKSDETKKEIEKGIEQEKERAAVRKRITDELPKLWRELQNGDMRDEIVGNLKQKAGANTADGTVARALLDRAGFASYQQGAELLRKKDYAGAVSNFAITAAIAPDNASVLYNLACAYSLSGAKDKALEFLEKAVSRGFRDVGHMEKDKDLDPLRADPRYVKIIDALKK